MLLTTRVVAEARVAYETTAEIDGPKLIATAQSRENLVRERGQEWTAGAITAFAQEFVEAAEQRYEEAEVGLLATNLAMTAWLNDSIFGGVTAEDFLQSHLIFTISGEDDVSYARVPMSTGAH
jgi:hypothetical protein